MAQAAEGAVHIGTMNTSTAVVFFCSTIVSEDDYRGYGISRARRQQGICQPHHESPPSFGLTPEETQLRIIVSTLLYI